MILICISPIFIHFHVFICHIHSFFDEVSVQLFAYFVTRLFAFFFFLIESWELFTYFGKKILCKTCNFQIFSFLGLFDWFSFFIIFSDLTILKAFNVHSFYLSLLKSLIFIYWADKNTKKYKSIKTMINISISIILIKKIEYQHYFFQFLYS